MPTREEKLKLIRDKCVEANPSIKDLVMGCKVFDLEENKECVVWKTSLDMPKPEVYLDTSYPHYEAEYRFSAEENPSGYHYKILGRDIRLADVLCMIQTVSIQYAIDTNGEFLVMKETKDRTQFEFKSAKFHWYLTQDNLEDQSDKTINFIYQLIENK